MAIAMDRLSTTPTTGGKYSCVYIIFYVLTCVSISFSLVVFFHLIPKGFVTTGTDSTMEEFAAVVVGTKEALNHFSVEELPIDVIIDVLLLRQRTWITAEMQMKATIWVMMTLDVMQVINHHNSIILSLKMTMYAGRFKDLAIPKKVRSFLLHN